MVVVNLAETHRTQLGPAEWRLDLPQVATSSQFFPWLASGGGFCRLRVLGPEPEEPLAFGASFAAEAVWGTAHFPFLCVTSSSSSPVGSNPPVPVVAHTGFERFYLTLRPLNPSTKELKAALFKKLHLILSFGSSATQV